jgi:3-isopropylmalate dehydratase small subunit
MTLANLASEMGAKNAVFPPDEVLSEFLGEEKIQGVWADEDAKYAKELEIDLDKLFPLVAAPHHVDNVKALSEVQGTPIHQGVIGTCTNGRLDDIQIAAKILKGKKIAEGFQLIIIPASQEVYLRTMEDGSLASLMEAGANVLSPSCGPCLGTGQGIPADGYTVLSTANRNFLGRMGNKNASIYLASPATVATSAIHGVITDPRGIKASDAFPYKKKQSETVEISSSENRKSGSVWNYGDVDNFNTDQMFAGNLTYDILSSDPEAIIPHLFAGLDPDFSGNAESGDIIVGGDNFGCGSSREHPAVGLASIGIKAVIVKSVNRIFYRSAINQGLALIVNPEIVDHYKPGMILDIDFEKSLITLDGTRFTIPPLPEKLLHIIEKKGLVNFLREES